MTTDYDEFIAGKARREIATGHEPGELPSGLFDFQRAIVQWAIRLTSGGRGIGATTRAVVMIWRNEK